MLTLKVLMTARNAVFLLVGVILIYYTPICLTVYMKFHIFVKGDHSKQVLLLFGTGLFMFFTSIHDGLGLGKKQLVIINLFSVLAFVLLYLTNCFQIYKLIQSGDIIGDIELRMTDALGDYSNVDETTEAWDSLQQDFKCCGLKHPSDWASTNIEGRIVQENEFNFTILLSCSDSSTNEIYQRGCLTALKYFFSDIIASVLITSIFAIFGQFIAIFVPYIEPSSKYEYETQSKVQEKGEKQSLL